MDMKETFISHGIPVAAAEERTSAMCARHGECRFVIAAKGFALVVNPLSGRTKQIFFPENNREYPFASLSSKGLFYTGAGKMILVLDPFLEKFVFYSVINNGEEIAGFSFAEGKGGNIYFTTYPHCHLFGLCPSDWSIKDFGRMDPSEKYPSSAAADVKGWIYVGIGTERKNIVAFDPDSGVKKSLVPHEDRTKGAGYVYQATDGKVYGHWEAGDMREVSQTTRWKMFLDGAVEGVDPVERASSIYAGEGFQKVHTNLDAEYKVDSYSLSEGFAEFIHNGTGQRKVIELTYESEGAQLSTLFLGPDEQIYGTSMHPLQLFRYCPESGELRNYGGKVIERGGGGNIAAYASKENLVFGAAYAGGKFYILDTQKPIEQNLNPRLVLQVEDIHRPRCAIAAIDKKHIIWGGFPGYGLAGGGLAIYSTETGQASVIPHGRIVPNQSTLCLGELQEGLILGGTSVETPGGASSAEKEAHLYLLEWKTEKPAERFVPVEGVREIVQLFIDPFNLVHCLTDSSLYFICNPYTKEVLFRKDLSESGFPVRNSFAYFKDSGTLFLLLSKALLSCEIRKGIIANPSTRHYLTGGASSGIVLHKGRVYYGSGSRLISIGTCRSETQ
ncbi:hypothetical protein [Bacillus infantis]|uniref:hypothetical protein n=2 Tax=Bacillus infantis TaxID=324767 RepID=UPI00301B0B9A